MHGRAAETSNAAVFNLDDGAKTLDVPWLSFHLADEAACGIRRVERKAGSHGEGVARCVAAAWLCAIPRGISVGRELPAPPVGSDVRQSSFRLRALPASPQLVSSSWPFCVPVSLLFPKNRSPPPLHGALPHRSQAQAPGLLPGMTIEDAVCASCEQSVNAQGMAGDARRAGRERERRGCCASRRRCLSQAAGRDCRAQAECQRKREAYPDGARSGSRAGGGDRARPLVKHAAALGNFVRIDIEDSSLTASDDRHCAAYSRDADGLRSADRHRDSVVPLYRSQEPISSSLLRGRHTRAAVQGRLQGTAGSGLPAQGRCGCQIC